MSPYAAEINVEVLRFPLFLYCLFRPEDARPRGLTVPDHFPRGALSFREVPPGYIQISNIDAQREGVKDAQPRHALVNWPDNKPRAEWPGSPNDGFVVIAPPCPCGLGVEGVQQFAAKLAGRSSPVPNMLTLVMPLPPSIRSHLIGRRPMLSGTSPHTWQPNPTLP
jgi:hypothetical protein